MGTLMTQFVTPEPATMPLSSTSNTGKRRHFVSGFIIRGFSTDALEEEHRRSRRPPMRRGKLGVQIVSAENEELFPSPDSRIGPHHETRRGRALQCEGGASICHTLWTVAPPFRVAL